MKQQQSFVSRSIRSVVQGHEDLPAIHAGFLVLSFLAAAMFRLGFFAVLIIVRMVLDAVKGRDIERRSWSATFEGVVRGSLLDIGLLTFGFAFAMVFHPMMLPVASVTGLPLAIFTLTRGISVTLPKLKILSGFLHVFFHMERHFITKNTSIGTSLQFSERAAILLFLCSAGLLLLIPILLPVSWDEYLLLLLSECIPWKM